jgi:lantibiotic modifying enzyme
MFGASMFFAGVNIKADTDVTSFENWRPWLTDCGCHSGATNTIAEGEVEFDAPLTVQPGQAFTVRLRVVGFNDAAGGAISLGLNVDDFDNGDFLADTVAAANHGVNGSGYSTSWTSGFSLVAPDAPGDYLLFAYGVDGLGGTSAWSYVQGSFVVSVGEGAQQSLSTYIESAAEYLMAVAVPDGGGLKWAEFNGSAAKFKTGYLKGTTGVGEFFLDLYNSYKGDPFFGGITPNAEQYLDVAKGAAAWLQARAIAENDGYKWPQSFEGDNSISGSNNYTSMYDGAAGIGTFFLDMYRTTGDATYLPYAEGAANWLESVANKTYGFAFTEHDAQDQTTDLSTRWTFGSPGIGGFFIDLYLATDNSTYFTWANETVEGLIHYALTDEGGYSWTQLSGNTKRFVGRWHGAAGVATFFLEMYDLTGNTTFLDYAEGTADWIYGTHEENQGDFYPDDNATVTKDYKLGGWSRSPAGIGSFFLRLYETTGTQTYMDHVVEIASFLIANATMSNGGMTWEDSTGNDRIATAIGHGLAGTGMFFVEAFQATGSLEYSAVIQSITQALGDMAVDTVDGFAWTQSDVSSDVHFGLYYGVAGVGKFLNLAAHSGLPEAHGIDEALDYLESTAVADSGGLKWAEFNGTAAKYKTNYLKGAAGIGTFFLSAYKMRYGNPFFEGIFPTATSHLDVAKGAATWLQARAIAENDGYKWPRNLEADNSFAGSSTNQTSMYAGAAGIGTYFLEMFRATGDPTYLSYAEGAANWLESVANKTYGFAFTEHDSQDQTTELSTRWTFGSPGIGGFFINMYLATDNSTYFSWANETVEGLIHYALTDEGGYSWTQLSGNTKRFVGRWHGAAGIGLFFAEMYDLTGNTTFLDYAEGTADWIYGTHEENQGDFYPDDNATATKDYKLGGWSRSPAGIGSFFGRMYETTNNPLYMNNMTQIMEFLRNNATAVNDGLVWADSSSNDRIATAMGHGLAGTGMFMLQGTRLNHAIEYRQVLEGVANALEDLTYHESVGASWTQSDVSTDVHMGLYYGVAGVGYFLLKASTSYPVVDFEAPAVSSPADLNLDVDDVASIQWTIEDIYPGSWSVTVDSMETSSSDTFDTGDVVNATVDTSAAGTFTYEITVTDFFGQTTTDSVTVVVTAATTTPTTTTTPPSTTTPPPTTPPGEIPFEFQLALYGSLLFNVVLIAVLIASRRR